MMKSCLHGAIIIIKEASIHLLFSTLTSRIASEARRLIVRNVVEVTVVKEHFSKRSKKRKARGVLIYGATDALTTQWSIKTTLSISL